MALGVLNNLSAIYAENNLNNTSNSLQNVLQQLSSGSRINSGADDAAGLSLVNGLAANSSALSQSETNATEGVGLLQVADGALSQVTSLLDRAITLATEASNGTLNSTQEGAANQEYQSIMSEVNNIGQTTTYNQQKVFDGQVVAIYTGDSSLSGSSVDELNIRSLSEASVGDTGGKMAYSDGENNVFLNLSTSADNAQATDTLNASGSTTININYLVKGANNTESTATTSITVGTGTTFSNTADGLISAINSAGLGLSANFTTQTNAGVTGGGTQTGIEISGGVVAAGVDPSSVSTSGTLNLSGTAASALLSPGQTITVQSGSTTAVSIVTSSTVATLAELAQAINNGDSAITATVITNGDNTQSLSLSDNSSSGGLLSVTTTQSGYVPQISSDDINGAAVPDTFDFAAGTTGTATTASNATVSLTGGLTTALGSDVITGDISLTGVNGTEDFVMGGVASAGTIAVGSSSATETLNDLATAINTSGIGITATVTTAGLSLTMSSDGATAIAGTSNLTDTLNPDSSYASLGSFSSQTDTLSAGSISFTVAGTPQSVTVTAGETVSTLVSDIQAQSATLGVTAAWVPTGNNGFGNVVLTSTTAGTAGNVTNASSTVMDTTKNVSLTYTASSSYNTGISNSSDTTTALYDSSTGQTATAAGEAQFVSNVSAASGMATISYTDGAGEDLSTTDLTSQSDAQAALNKLNVAVTDVASMDGYIGAQINTLNSISQVMTTQKENVTSAQNAIQATDYASATSNMSKYEILSQTGIAALAQANSVQQEVTKLLQ